MSSMQAHYEVIVYKTIRGDIPVAQFLREMDQKSRMKVFAFLRSKSEKALRG